MSLENKMSESLVEKIKQESKTTLEISDGFNKYPVDFHHDEKWVKLSDVLKILEGYLCISKARSFTASQLIIVEKQKLRELAALLKNRTKIEDDKQLFEGKYLLYTCEELDQKVREFEKCFEVYEKKFAELGLDTKKETIK